MTPITTNFCFKTKYVFCQVNLDTKAHVQTSSGDGGGSNTTNDDNDDDNVKG